MNKILKKDKTNFMKLVLSFFIILILILGTIFIKIKIFATNVDLEVIRINFKKANYDIKIGLYFFGLIKILGIRINNGFIEFLFFKKNISDLLNSNMFLNNIKPKIDKIPKSKMLESFNKINFRLDDFKFNLQFGTDSVIITSILVGIISAIISSSLEMYIEKFSKEKYKWKILPDYNEKLFMKLKASMKLSYSPIISRIVRNE